MPQIDTKIGEEVGIAGVGRRGLHMRSSHEQTEDSQRTIEPEPRVPSELASSFSNEA